MTRIDDLQKQLELDQHDSVGQLGLFSSNDDDYLCNQLGITVNEFQSIRSIIAFEIAPKSLNLLDLGEEYLITGNVWLDSLFASHGIPRGQLIEVVGEAGCGKSQLAIWTAIQVIKTFDPSSDDKVLYVSINKPFPIKRLEHYFSSDQSQHQHLMDKMLIINCYDTESLLILTSKLVDMVEQYNIKMVVFDSIAAVLRYPYDTMADGGSCYVSSQDAIHQFASTLQSVTRDKNIIAICVNQVSSIIKEIPDYNSTAFIPDNISTANKLKPALGDAWQSYVRIQLWVKKAGHGVRQIIVENSLVSSSAQSECKFTIGDTFSLIVPQNSDVIVNQEDPLVAGCHGAV
ncbi:hypothetical protein MIR68_005441 [Amoeboaphelidium protococcarum]|nr:hypothetical protein MIR68_005441 [Amoeboaphelidium protococcarum]